VGFTATTPDIDLTIEVCKYIKEKNRNIITIIGGSHATALPSEVASSEYVDYVIVGDGEYPLDLIISYRLNKWNEDKIKEGILYDKYFAQNFRMIKGGNFKNNKIVKGRIKSLNKLKIPDYDLLDYSKYQFTDPLRGSLNTAYIFTSRGCPFNCKFCFHDKKLRLRPIDKIFEEIKYLIERKGVKYFCICDDTFNVIRKRTLKILNKIIDLNLNNIYFQCWTRANLIDEEIVEKMKKANFVRVSMGIESGSEKILELNSKGIKKEEYIKTCKLLSNAEIETRGSFIIGHPFETRETVKQTINFSKQLELYEANFTLMTPYPGTEIYNMALKGEGIHFRNKKYINNWKSYRRWGKAIIKTDKLSAEELEQLRIEAHTKFYTQKKVYNYYRKLFLNGNKSRYFYRPLNFAWKTKYNENIPFWDKLEKSEVVDA